MMDQFWRHGKFRDLCRVVPYQRTKIKNLVRSGQWVSGLHYVTDPNGDRLYNLTLIADWVANINDPVAHERACELYVASLPSNQAKPSQRKAVAA